MAVQRSVRPRKRRRETGLRIGKLFGVELVLDWSLLIVFGLIAFSLAIGVFPEWHPAWSSLRVWTVAAAAAVLFFASIAAHEMSHALVGRANGIPVRRITLFVFGGMAQMDREPGSPRAEFLMAAVGPLTSIVIGVGATALGFWLGGDELRSMQSDPVAALRSLDAVSTLLLWLGPINVLLGIFNLVPGFPLDGGRVLRSVLWWTTGNLERATRWAARVGQGVAWGLMGIGAVMLFGYYIPVLGGGVIQGLWLILIGWFLNSAAKSSYRQLQIREALERVHVRDIMRANVDGVLPGVTIDALMREHFAAADEGALPVIVDGTMLGLISVDDVKAIPHERWGDVEAGEVMRPASQLPRVQPSDDAMEALRTLSEQDLTELPVSEDGHVVGVLRRKDIMRWLASRTDLTG